jgi:hypothetical protein
MNGSRYIDAHQERPTKVRSGSASSLSSGSCEGEADAAVEPGPIEQRVGVMRPAADLIEFLDIVSGSDRLYGAHPPECRVH